MSATNVSLVKTRSLPSGGEYCAASLLREKAGSPEPESGARYFLIRSNSDNASF